MQIIIEGPDGAGKTTLINYLSEKMGIPSKHSGGPSKYPGEVNARTREFNADPTTLLYDRHPAISQNIYVQALQNKGEIVHPAAIEEFYDLKPFIIYCRNERGLEAGGHRASKHSSQEHADRVTARFQAVCEGYDRWALIHANLIYRIGDDMEALSNLIAMRVFAGRIIHPFDPWADIVAFHEKFDIAYTGKPRQLDEELARFREKFMGEELDEYIEARVGGAKELRLHQDEANFVHHLELQFDSLIDKVYVDLGTAYLQGFDFVEGWRRVHAANMRKVRAPSAEASASTTGRGHASDVIKPKGWGPPKHTDLIEDHAHRDQFE